MKARSLVVACLALAVVAGDEGSSAPATPAGHRITGMVHDDEGIPVAGAAVTVYPGPHHVVTDATGRFEVTQAQPDTIEVFVAKPGYEPIWRFFSAPAIDIVLHDIVRIAVGQSTRVTIGPTDGVGGADNEYLIRVVRVTGNARVPVVGVIADDNGPVNYWIRAGTELEVEIRIPWNAASSRTFTVITAAMGS